MIEIKTNNKTKEFYFNSRDYDSNLYLLSEEKQRILNYLESESCFKQDSLQYDLFETNYLKETNREFVYALRKQYPNVSFTAYYCDGFQSER